MENLLLISGSQALLRHRLLHLLIKANEDGGVRIDHVDGAQPGAIGMAMSGSMFFTGNSLAVVSNPHKGDLDLYREHRKTKNATAVLLLHHEGEPKGNTKFGKFVKELGPKAHQRFSAPNKWKAADEAAEFVVREAKTQHGKTITARLARALVQRAGSDFGVLVFEIRKMALLASAEGSSTIEAEHIKQGMAELVEVDIGLLLDAFRGRNRRALTNILHRIKLRSSKDPTMMVCRLLGSEATKWLQAASLKHMPPKAAAAELGINAWYFENKILPVAKLWGLPALAHLISALAAGERGVLDGHNSPWIGLCCGLLSAC